MFKRTWQVVFWDARNVFGAPKLIAKIFPSRVGEYMHTKSSVLLLLNKINSLYLQQIQFNDWYERYK